MGGDGDNELGVGLAVVRGCGRDFGDQAEHAAAFQDDLRVLVDGGVDGPGAGRGPRVQGREGLQVYLDVEVGQPGLLGIREAVAGVVLFALGDDDAADLPQSGRFDPERGRVLVHDGRDVGAGVVAAQHDLGFVVGRGGDAVLGGRRLS